MNKKIKIAVLSSDTFGIGMARFIEPHKTLQKLFPEEFEIEINVQPVNFNDFSYLEKFDIIFGHKEMCSITQAKEIFPKLREKGIKIIIDIDDYWNLCPGHPSYEYAKQIKYGERVIEMLPLVDYITTTTDYFANEIKKYNKNVVVFPNAADPDSKRFKVKDIESERVRLMYLAGSSHLLDVQLLKSMLTTINDKYHDKIQTVLCGFDTRGITKVQDQYGKFHERPILPEETCWYEYEKIFTSNYKYLSEEYKKHLRKYKDEEFSNVENEPYRRVWTKPISTYSLNYNLGDITLAPLVVNKFNESKSQLKVIESGFFHKPLIASDIEPYRIDIQHGVNGFLVKNNSGTKDWAYYVKKLIDDPILRKEMGENLYNTVKDKYNINNVSTSRANWYKEILKK